MPSFVVHPWMANAKVLVAVDGECAAVIATRRSMTRATTPSGVLTPCCSRSSWPLGGVVDGLDNLPQGLEGSVHGRCFQPLRGRAQQLNPGPVHGLQSPCRSSSCRLPAHGGARRLASDGNLRSTARQSRACAETKSDVWWASELPLHQFSGPDRSSWMSREMLVLASRDCATTPTVGAYLPRRRLHDD